MTRQPKSPPIAWLLGALGWLRRREIATVFSLVFVVGGGWAFIELADEVMEGDTKKFDERIIDMLGVEKDGRLHPAGPRWLKNAARDITALGSMPVLVLVVAGVTGLLLLVKDRAAACLVAGTTILGAVIGLVMKEFFDRPRPDFLERLDDVFTKSFPSGHSMMAAIVYLTLGELLAGFVKQRVLKAYFLGVAVLLTVLVGVSRVYVGAHFPTDVLAGWTAGLVWATFCGFVANIVKKTWKSESTLSVEGKAK